MVIENKSLKYVAESVELAVQEYEMECRISTVLR